MHPDFFEDKCFQQSHLFWDDEAWEKFFQENERMARCYRETDSEEQEFNPLDLLFSNKAKYHDNVAIDEDDTMMPIFKEAPVVSRAHDFTLLVNKFKISSKNLSEAILDLISNHAMQISTNLVGGHVLGYSKETLGANIAKCKRALKSADTCVEAIALLEKRAKKPMGNIADHAQNLRTEIERWITTLKKRAYWN